MKAESTQIIGQFIFKLLLETKKTVKSRKKSFLPDLHK